MQAAPPAPLRAPWRPATVALHKEATMPLDKIAADDATVRTMTNEAFLAIYDTLGSLRDALREPIYRHRAVTMRQQMQAQAEPLVAMRTDVEDHRVKAFEEAKQQLIMQLCARDADEKPVISNNSYTFSAANQAVFNTSLAKLRLEEEYADKVREFDELVEKTVELFKQKQEFTLPGARIKLKLSWFNGLLDQDRQELLYDLIEVDEEACLAQLAADRARADKAMKAAEDKAAKAEAKK